MSATRTVAVVYATTGGLGDVGKYAVAHALKAPDVTVRAIAMASRATATPRFDFQVDVQPAELQEQLKADFDKVTPVQVIVEDADSRGQLEEQFRGVDAVIACVGSRQPGYKYPELKSRWCASGAQLVTASMAAAGVQRLVLLSSFGIGDDFLPSSLIKTLWAVMLRTGLSAARKDLTAMEQNVTGTDLDYLLVRAAGLTPEEAPTGTWKILKARGGNVGFSIAKSDVAQYLLQEALAPSVHRQAVTIGGSV